MKANAPERLYLSKNIYGTYLYQVPDPDDETAVEYIRKDAFIKKFECWMNENFYQYAGEFGEEISANFDSIENCIKDFKKYIKGE